MALKGAGLYDKATTLASADVELHVNGVLQQRALAANTLVRSVISAFCPWLDSVCMHHLDWVGAIVFWDSSPLRVFRFHGR